MLTGARKGRRCGRSARGTHTFTYLYRSPALPALVCAHVSPRARFRLSPTERPWTRPLARSSPGAQGCAHAPLHAADARASRRCLLIWSNLYANGWCTISQRSRFRHLPSHERTHFRLTTSPVLQPHAVARALPQRSPIRSVCSVQPTHCIRISSARRLLTATSLLLACGI